jgi:hypothetical protein
MLRELFVESDLYPGTASAVPLSDNGIGASALAIGPTGAKARTQDSLIGTTEVVP